MYFPVFSSSEYYSNKDINNNKFIDENNAICLICWLPQEKHNEIKLLSEFLHIKINCNCKPKLHYNCINEWIKQSQTCPICRTKINIIFTTNNNNCYIFCISFTIKLLTIICHVSFAHLLCILFYNIFYIYMITNNNILHENILQENILHENILHENILHNDTYKLDIY